MFDISHLELNLIKSNIKFHKKNIRIIIFTLIINFCAGILQVSCIFNGYGKYPNAISLGVLIMNFIYMLISLYFEKLDLKYEKMKELIYEESQFEFEKIRKNKI